jgi:hypothetical protein
MLYAPFKLKCYDLLKQLTIEYMSKFDGDDIYNSMMSISDDVAEIFNKEMESYELPSLLHFIAFKRKNWIVKDKSNPTLEELRGLHVDYSIKKQQSIKTSLVFPISGCEGTDMYFLGGDFEIVPDLTKDDKRTYGRIVWKEKPFLLDRVCINDTPMLAKVDVPHDTDSKMDGSYRITLTAKLVGNPDITEVYEKLKKHGCLV